MNPSTDAAQQTDFRRDDVFNDGVSVIEFLDRSFRGFLDYKPLSDYWKKGVASALHGMKIRVTHGSHDNKFTFNGLTSETTEDFEAGENQDKLFVFIYKKLPCLDLGKLIYVPMEWCAVYGQDNPSNEKLRRIIYPEILRERHYLDQKRLEKKWRLIFLGQKTPHTAANITKFGQDLASKCGESMNDEIIYITDPKELKAILQSKCGESRNYDTILFPDVREVKENLSTVKKGEIQILLCVMEKDDQRSYKALKREVEVEKEILTQCCKLGEVEKYLRDSEKSAYLANLASEMIAKAGIYREKSLLPRHALPSRFDEKSKVMYLGCNVINCSPPVTVVVGNINGSVLHTCGYQSKVFRGDYTKQLPTMLDELVNAYKKVNDKSWPKKIIYFREGFMGGQHQDIQLQKEAAALKANDTIRITVIVPHKNKGCRSENAKPNYSLYVDENGFFRSEFDKLIKNLRYSWRCSKPLPAYYADLAATSAKIYLEGNEKTTMTKIEAAVNRNLYVRGVHKTMEPQQVQDMQE